MDDRKLEVFLAAAETGSLSKAAVELGCTQSAVTQAMNSLEAELGCRVLERGHGGVRLTDAGRQLLPTAERARSYLGRLRDQATAIGEGRALPLRVGCFSSIATTWLPGALMAYRDQDATASFEVRVGTNSLTDSLIAGKTDLVLGDVDWLRAFACTPLMEDRFLAVVPVRYLDEYPWLGEGGCITREQLFSLPSAMVPMNALERHFENRSDRLVHIACDDDSTLVTLVARGLGVAVVPELSLRDVSPNVRVFELVPAATRTLGVALPDVPSEAAVRFARFLQAYMSEA